MRLYHLEHTIILGLMIMVSPTRLCAHSGVVIMTMAQSNRFRMLRVKACSTHHSYEASLGKLGLLHYIFVTAKSLVFKVFFVRAGLT